MTRRDLHIQWCSMAQDNLFSNKYNAIAGAVPNVPGGKPKIEVVASRREQKRQQMPPPPPVPRQPQQTSEGPPHGFKAPNWACHPPEGAVLHVVKAGDVIDQLTLNKAATLFGRYEHMPANDSALTKD